MLYSTIAQVGLVAMASVCILAGLMGDRWGRLSALLHATNWMAVCMFQSDARRGLLHLDFMADSVGAVLAVWIAMASDRTWALFIAAFQILGVANYLPPLINPKIYLRTFVAASYLWELGSLASLVWAGLDGRKRKRD